MPKRRVRDKLQPVCRMSAHFCSHDVSMRFLMLKLFADLLLSKLAVGGIMMVSVFRPDAGDDFLFDGDLNVDGVAFLLVFFVALLVWDLFAVGNLVRRAMLLRHLFAMRNGDVVAFLFRHFFGNVDVVAFFFRNLFVLGNINVFARLVRDFLAFLFVVVTGLALFSVSSLTLLFLLISSFGFVGGGTLLFLFIGGFVDGLALLLVFFSTFLFVSGFAMLLLLISACFCVFGNTFGYFNLFANLVMFGFVLLFVRFNFFLAFPVLFLARCVEMNIVALLFGYFFAHFMGDLFAVGYSVLTALFLGHVVAFGYIDIVALLLRHFFGNFDVVALFFRHLFGNFDVVAFFFGHLFVLGNINVFARLVGDFLAFLFVVVTGLALLSVSSVTFLFLFIGGFGFVGGGTLLFLVVFGFVDRFTLLLLVVFGFVNGFTLLFLFIGTFLFVFGLTMLLLFVFTLFGVSSMALIFVMSVALLFLFGLTCFGVVITAVTPLEQVKEERCWSSLGCSFNVASSHKAYKKEDLKQSLEIKLIHEF